MFWFRSNVTFFILLRTRHWFFSVWTFELFQKPCLSCLIEWRTNVIEKQTAEVKQLSVSLVGGAFETTGSFTFTSASTLRHAACYWISMTLPVNRTSVETCLCQYYYHCNITISLLLPNIQIEAFCDYGTRLSNLCMLESCEQQQQQQHWHVSFC